MSSLVIIIIGLICFVLKDPKNWKNDKDGGEALPRSDQGLTLNLIDTQNRTQNLEIQG